jgi:hypothetical protein
MLAFLKDKDNFTKKIETTAAPMVVALKKEYRYVKGWHVVYSIELNGLFVSSSNFSRKTWTTFDTAKEALENISKPFLKDISLDVSFIEYEEGHNFTSKDFWEYGQSIKTYYLNNLY